MRKRFPKTSEETAASAGLGELEVSLNSNLLGGVARYYQKRCRAHARWRVSAQFPFGDDRFLILTYLSVRELDVPEVVWAKLKAAK